MVPAAALSEAEILARLAKGEAASRKWYVPSEGGRLSGAVYCAEPSHWDLVAKVMRMYIVSNPPRRARP